MKDIILLLNIFNIKYIYIKLIWRLTNQKIKNIIVENGNVRKLVFLVCNNILN